MLRLRSFVATALLLGTPAYAQDKTGEIDKIFSFATPATPGCAVGVSRHGKVVVNRAYGLADVERRVPLSTNAMFDIGSTQKQFVAAAVLQLVQDGRLSLTDDIRKHVPELPDYGHKVTVDHLLTHTGGLRDWTGILPMAEEGTDVLQLDPAPAWPQLHARRRVGLLQQRLRAAEGDRGTRERDAVRRVRAGRLFEPLGMKSSAYVPDILQAGANAALGYQKGTGWKQYMRLGNRRGGGAIVSTVGDLIVWNDALASGKLGGFVTGKLQEPARLANGRKLKYARGLIVDSTPGGLVVSHSGGAAGFSTWMGRVPEHGLSVAVACNFDPVSATALAARVADLYLPASGAGAQAPAANTANAAGVDVTAGRGCSSTSTPASRCALPSPRKAPHRQRSATRRGDAGPLPFTSRRPVLSLAGRVRTDVPFAGCARAQVDGGGDPLPPRPALVARRG